MNRRWTLLLRVTFVVGWLALVAAGGCAFFRPQDDPSGVSDPTLLSSSESGNGAVHQPDPAKPLAATGQPAPQTGNTAQTQKPGRRFALLVGVNGYEKKGLQDLKYCDNDMRALAWVLETHGGYPAENITLLVDGRDGHEPTSENIMASLDNWRERGFNENDTVLFAFSGHGKATDDRAFLMPRDGDPKSLENVIGVKQVYESLERAGAGRNFIVIDACRNEGTRSAAPSSLKPVTLDLLGPKPRSSLYVLLSCDDGEVSHEFESLSSELQGLKGHGLFTHFLVRGLSGEANRVADDEILFSDLSKYTADHVRAYLQDHSDGAPQSVQLIMRGSPADLVIAKYTNPPSRELLALPGLVGRWWFEEAPWLLPHLRKDLVTHVLELKDRDDNSFLRQVNVLEVHQQLRAGFEDYRKSWPSEHEVRSALTKVVAANQKQFDVSSLEAIGTHIVPGTLNGTGEKHHTQAVLHHWHYLRTDNKNTKKAQLQFATAAYKDALKQYVEPGLRARCLADFGRLRHANGEYLLAAEKFDEARAEIKQEQALLLHAECWAQEAEAHRKLGDFDKAETCYRQVDNLFGEADKIHPLAVSTLKQKGWCFMDQLRIAEATEEFKQVQMRTKKHHDQHPEAGKRAEAHIMQFHTRHGLNMAARYEGNLPGATDAYEKLAIEVYKDYNAPEFKGERDREQFENRLANTYERLADCYLQAENKEAVVYFSDARRHYSRLPGRTEQRLRLHCKLSIAQVVTKSGNGQDPLKELDHDRKTQRADAESLAKIAHYEKVARAMVKAAADQSEQGLADLKSIVEDPAAKREVRDQFKRDEIDLQLIAARALIGWLPLDDPGLPKIVKQTFGMIPEKRGAHNEESLSYRREYYDVGLVAWLTQPGADDLHGVINHIAIAKTNRDYGPAPGKNIMIFYFPKDGESGYCVWRPQQGEGGVFPLEVGWEDLSGGQAQLPDELRTPLGQHGPIEVQWTDLVLGLKPDGSFLFQLPPDTQFKSQRH